MKTSPKVRKSKDGRRYIQLTKKKYYLPDYTNNLNKYDLIQWILKNFAIKKRRRPRKQPATKSKSSIFLDPNKGINKKEPIYNDKGRMAYENAIRRQEGKDPLIPLLTIQQPAPQAQPPSAPRQPPALPNRPPPALPALPAPPAPRPQAQDDDFDLSDIPYLEGEASSKPLKPAQLGHLKGARHGLDRQQREIWDLTDKLNEAQYNLSIAQQEGASSKELDKLTKEWKKAQKQLTDTISLSKNLKQANVELAKINAYEKIKSKYDSQNKKNNKEFMDKYRKSKSEYLRDVADKYGVKSKKEAIGKKGIYKSNVELVDVLLESTNKNPIKKEYTQLVKENIKKEQQKGKETTTQKEDYNIAPIFEESTPDEGAGEPTPKIKREPSPKPKEEQELAHAPTAEEIARYSQPSPDISDDEFERELNEQRLLQRYSGLTREQHSEYYGDSDTESPRPYDPDELERDIQEGEGMFVKTNQDQGLSNTIIDKYMKNHKGYLGTIASDEIVSRILPLIKPQSQGSFIMNLDPRHKAGSHWVAVYFDARPNGSNTIEYFDSYAEKPSNKFLQDSKLLAKKLNPNSFLKLKVNGVQKQHPNTTTCGWMAMKFIIDRDRGKKFSEASGYDVQNGEKEANKLKTNFKQQFGFGYINHLEQEGDGIFSVRTQAPPKVRKFLNTYGNQKIVNIGVYRKPIISLIQKAVNWIRKLTGREANKEYDKLFHLYIVFTLENGQVFKMERNQVMNVQRATQNDLTGPNVESKSVAVPHMTIKEMFDKASGGKAEFFRYHPTLRNCQTFVKDMLKAGGVLTTSLHSFIVQDVKSLLPKFITDIAEKVTDVAHVADKIIHGDGKENRKHI